jgi:hypothetical protein
MRAFQPASLTLAVSMLRTCRRRPLRRCRRHAHHSLSSGFAAMGMSKEPNGRLPDGWLRPQPKSTRTPAIDAALARTRGVVRGGQRIDSLASLARLRRASRHRAARTLERPVVVGNRVAAAVLVVEVAKGIAQRAAVDVQRRCEASWQDDKCHFASGAAHVRNC